jgi:hypothetical protein
MKTSNQETETNEFKEDKKIIIEIFKRAEPSVIIETKEIINLKSFLVYWNIQADKKVFSWRIK